MMRVKGLVLPLVSPWMEEGDRKFKLSETRTLDVTAGITNGKNAIILHTTSQSAGGSRKYHLEPISTSYSSSTLSARLTFLSRNSPCFQLRVFTQDGRVASCYAVGHVDHVSDKPPVLYCADTVHALLVYVLWPRATIDYHIGTTYNINIPKNARLSSPPTPEELERHGLCITTENDPDFGRPPMIQSCWECVYYYFIPRQGVHPGNGTRWCLHSGNYDIPDQLFENRLSAIVTPYFVRFTSEKRSVNKEYKTYQVLVQVGRTIDVPRVGPPVTEFTTAFQTAPVSPVSVGFMPRGAHPKSPADARWETIMRGEPCPHASSVSPPTVIEQVAPDRSAFLASLDVLPVVQGNGLVPIAGIGGMISIECWALSLSVADMGYWVYWKNLNQCLGCAVTLVRERFKTGTAVVFSH